jgi:hypothetical protein
MLLDNFWDDNYYNNPPLKDNMIVEAERILNVKLPPLFIDLLKIQNGGYTKNFVFPMSQKTTWAENYIPLDQLFGIVTDESHKSAHNILESAYMTEEWDLPEKQVLINGDGHWWITLDYRSDPNPLVKWIDVECEEEILIAESFDKFIHRLVLHDDFVK